ncbi:MAG: ABC transporter permease [Candidatus Omnitrophica bacterium]|jgi:ABC-type polysaccharide/polyol phosphate export permease|nr:ABC transporter permease [Candidatus Omnitrophota bacterium]
MNLSVREYFNLIKEFSLADFKIRDQRTVLGFLWSFINPMIMSAILFFLFKSRLMGDYKINYFFYILIGNVTWNFFSLSTTLAAVTLILKESIVKNFSFPKEILVLSAIGTFLIQHFFELLAVFIFAIIFKIGFSIHILWLPLILFTEIMLIAGLSLFLSCLCVYVKDIDHIWMVITRMGFFVVPIFYELSDISPKFKWLIAINPMTQIIIFLRDVLLYHRNPVFFNLMLLFLFNLIFLCLGSIFFNKNKYKIAERV